MQKAPGPQQWDPGAKLVKVKTPEGYVKCVEQMETATLQWLATRGPVGLAFSLPPRECGVIAALDSVTIPYLSTTPESAEFLDYLQTATGGQATAMMACVLIRVLELPFEEWSDEKMAGLLGRSGDVS